MRRFLKKLIQRFIHEGFENESGFHVARTISILSIGGLLIVGCSSSKPKSKAVNVVMPPSPLVASSFIQTETTQSAQGNSITLPPAPRFGTLTWYYEVSLPTPNIAFVFLSKTNLAQEQWAYHGETNQPEYIYALDKPQEFFICVASNTVTGEINTNWNK